MSRGQGLENTQDRAWVKQPNGRYTIFNVPIFGEFQDEKRGQVTMQDLEEVVKNFQADKQDNYRYPRIHIGHHEGNENRPGAGYLDSFRVENGVVYADLVEVTPEVFQAIRAKMKYPYVSAEYHPDRKKILSLALLESQAPFFSFPLLKLEETQRVPAMMFNFGFPELRLQGNPEDIERFTDKQAAWACRWDTIMKFQENYQEGCGCMEDSEEKKDSKIDTNPPSETKEPMIEEAPKEYKCQDDMVGMKDMIARMLAKVEKIYAWEEEEHEGGMSDEMGMDEGQEMPEMNPEEQPNNDFSATETPSEPMKGEENPMKKPSSVAYHMTPEVWKFMQEQAAMTRALIKKSDALDKKVAVLEGRQNFSSDEQKLKSLCDTHGLSFQEQSTVLRKFSSSQDRANYLGSLAMLKPMERHPAGAINLPAQSQMMTSEDKVLQKYQDRDSQQKQIAQEAYAKYRDVVSKETPENVKKFQKAWGNVERFVDYAVQMLPHDPHVLDRIFVK